MAFRWQAFGDAARRVTLPDGVNRRVVLETLRAVPYVVDAVVCERHAMVTFDPATPPEGLDEAIERAASSPSATATAREHTVRVRYGPPDLDEVAARVGLSPGEVVARHAGGTYEVVAVGFLPGFAYLRGIDASLVLPRRASPRARVAAGSVGLAGPYTGIYPFAAPGGWNLIGVAAGFTPFDPRSGAALSLGDRVRFVAEPS